MKHLAYAVVLFVALALVSCEGKKKESEVTPPGFCQTEAECQPMADHQNAYQEELREKLIAQGVHGKYLPCGPYKTVKAPNGFWQVTRDTTGCPTTASQQDPSPSKAKQHKQ